MALVPPEKMQSEGVIGYAANPFYNHQLSQQV
jgi:hypothetical protein